MKPVQRYVVGYYEDRYVRWVQRGYDAVLQMQKVKRQGGSPRRYYFSFLR